jgi:hypothetical protein
LRLFFVVVVVAVLFSITAQMVAEEAEALLSIAF